MPFPHSRHPHTILFLVCSQSSFYIFIPVLRSPSHLRTMCFGNHDDAHGGRRPRPQPNRPVELQPVRRDNRAHHNNNSNNHHNNRNPRSNTPTALPPRTSNDMSPAIRAEVLTATHQAFGQLAYGIIGGVALAEYGQARGTNDVDVMIPRDISEIAESTILSSARFTRTTGGGIG